MLLGRAGQCRQRQIAPGRAPPAWEGPPSGPRHPSRALASDGPGCPRLLLRTSAGVTLAGAPAGRQAGAVIAPAEVGLARERRGFLRERRGQSAGRTATRRPVHRPSLGLRPGAGVSPTPPWERPVPRPPFPGTLDSNLPVAGVWGGLGRSGVRSSAPGPAQRGLRASQHRRAGDGSLTLHSGLQLVRCVCVCTACPCECAPVCTCVEACACTYAHLCVCVCV